MFRKFTRWFRRDRNVIYPFRALNQAMRDKDPVLYSDVGWRTPSEAVRRWREVYPEDFVGVEGHSPWPNASVIKQTVRPI